MQSKSQKREIAPSIMTLLACFWAADETPQTRQAIAEAWLEDLVEFDAAVVAETCREWRRTQTRRPLIADIYKLAREYEGIAARRAERALPPPPQGSVSAEFIADKGWQNDYRLPSERGDVDVETLWRRREASIAHNRRRYELAAADRAKYSRVETTTTSLRAVPLEPGEEPMSAEEKERIRRDSRLLVEEAA